MTKDEFAEKLDKLRTETALFSNSLRVKAHPIYHSLVEDDTNIVFALELLREGNHNSWQLYTLIDDLSPTTIDYPIEKRGKFREIRQVILDHFEAFKNKDDIF